MNFKALNEQHCSIYSILKKSYIFNIDLSFHVSYMYQVFRLKTGCINRISRINYRRQLFACVCFHGIVNTLHHYASKHIENWKEDIFFNYYISLQVMKSLQNKPIFIAKKIISTVVGTSSTSISGSIVIKITDFKTINIQPKTKNWST